MSEEPIPEDFARSWTWLGLNPETFEEEARWIETPRELGSGCGSFFEMAGKLMRCARTDHTLMSPAFFHAVIGLERALRVHYKRPDESYGSLCQGSDLPFSQLFRKAIDEGLFHDGLFAEVPAFPEFLRKSYGDLGTCGVVTLAEVIPKLRNEYFHGHFLLSSELIFIAIQLRELADALKTSPERTLLD